ncbi:MAG: AlpA family transcriptional regulator [Sphingomonas bacterium]|nr:AlpA family transcriptional regulator [Sphingomonas bacterium]
MTNGSPERILRLPEVKSRTGLSRSSIYAKIADDTFPKQKKLGHRIVGWFESDVTAWITARD